MTADQVPVTVTILDKEYRIACPEDEQVALATSASYLDTRMKEIRDSGKVVGVDRIAVMAALNLTHELLTQRTERENFNHTVATRLRYLQERVNKALEEGQQVEL